MPPPSLRALEVVSLHPHLCRKISTGLCTQGLPKQGPSRLQALLQLKGPGSYEWGAGERENVLGNSLLEPKGRGKVVWGCRSPAGLREPGEARVPLPADEWMPLPLLPKPSWGCQGGEMTRLLLSKNDAASSFL